MSTRIKITLADDIVARLNELAEAAGQPLARVAGQIVRDGLKTPAAEARGHRSAPADEPTLTRAAWLEPYGGDREWRQYTWGSILALSGRYPDELNQLRHGWWTNESLVETLCAFAHWRQLLDDGGRDPREELDFQLNLIELGRRLTQLGGGVTTEWTPGAPPAGWC
jgi:hypothetical protein